MPEATHFCTCTRIQVYFVCLSQLMWTNKCDTGHLEPPVSSNKSKLLTEIQPQIRQIFWNSHKNVQIEFSHFSGNDGIGTNCCILWWISHFKLLQLDDRFIKQEDSLHEMINITGVIGMDKSGLVFTKGLRLSQVLGLNPVLKLRLLSQLSFVLKPYSQTVT